MLSLNGLFEREYSVLNEDLHNEMFLQLYYLQMHCAKFTLSVVKETSTNIIELVTVLRSFVEVGLEIYNERGVNPSYVFQCGGQLLRQLGESVTVADKAKLSKLIMVGLLSLRLMSELPRDATFISDVLVHVASGKQEAPKINIMDLRDAFVNQPYITKTVVAIVNPHTPLKELYSACLDQAVRSYEDGLASFLKMLHLVGLCSTSPGFGVALTNTILSFTGNRKCLFEHLTLEIGLSQSSEQRYQFSLSMRDQVMAEIIRKCDQLPEKIVDSYEQLCFCLFVNGLPSMSSETDSLSQIGWLVLVTHSRSTVSLLLNVIKTLIEARLVEPLTRLLKSPSMSDFNQLLLVNLWHPNLADEATREILLELCYPVKSTEVQTNYIEQLCFKIRSRRETLKKFNERLSSINREREKPAKEILALTTIGNTSHLELVTVLPDPTGLDINVVLDILDRTGGATANSSIGTMDTNLPLETEAIEEHCDKSIFYCSVSIRKVWECLVLFSSIETRHRLFTYLHQQNLMMDVHVIPTERSFSLRFQQALQNNDAVTCDELYQTYIVPRLGFLIRHLDDIHPLALRLELLENLYSMLFVTERDLFANMLTASNLSQGNRPMWPLPETGTGFANESVANDDDVSPNCDKNRFVCSFFLFKDLLAIVAKSLQALTLTVTSLSNAGITNDAKMSKLINCATVDDIKARASQLSTIIADMLWRIDLLTLKNQDDKSNTMSILDIPTCVLYDPSSKNISDANMTRPNMRNRSKSNAHAKKGKAKSRKDRLSSHGEEKESSHPELSPKIIQLGILQSTASLTLSLSSQHNKDKFFLFQPPVRIEMRDSFTICGTDDGEYNSPKLFERQQSKRMSKEQCLFLMECVPLLVEPIDQLAVSILNHGFIDRAEEIYRKYGHPQTDNASFNDVLSEIQYRHHFDSLTSQLSAITTPVNATEPDPPENTEGLQFGKFNWSKLSSLNTKLSSRKEDEVVKILNQLLTLDRVSRPSFPVDESSGNLGIKRFNCGLLFDIAIVGSSSNWQLSQMITLIESHYAQSDPPFTDLVDSSKYHKVQSLITITNQIQKALSLESGSKSIVYTELELNTAIDVDYHTFMTQWFGQLETLLKSLKCDDYEDSEDSAEAQSRSNCLSSLISFIKETCTDIDGKELPFKHFSRPIPQYLEALYSHLEVFANFLNKYKTPPDKLKKSGQSSSDQLQHEFSVMRRSPLNALGELIFIKSVDPFSPEMLQISKDLGLNISSVVLENCIPTISASAGHALSPEVEDGLLNHRRDVYNPSSEAPQEDVEGLNPLEVVTDCLNKIVKIMQKNLVTFNQATSQLEPTSPTIKRSQTPSNVLGHTVSALTLSSMDTSSSESSNRSRESYTVQYKSSIPNVNSSNILLNCGWRVLMMFSSDDDWRDLLLFEIVDLEHVDLNLLKNNNEKVAFFINLYNLMMIHMAIVVVESGKTILKYRSLESKLFRSNFCYKVGQIGVVSIDDIHHHYLNIPDVTFADTDQDVSELASSLPTPMEQCYRISPNSCQNLILFSLIDNTVSGQPLRVYYPESLQKDLQNNLSYVIKYSTTYESDKRQIFLPQIFKWYAKYICPDSAEQRHRQVSDASKSATSSNSDEILIERILGMCTEKVARKFSLLLRLDTDTMTHNIKEQTSNKLLKIIWQSRSEAIGCSVIEQRQEVAGNIPKLQEHTASGQSSLNSVTSVIVKSNFPLPNYQPTTEALDHLRDRSPLLACLAYLIIGNDFIFIPIRVLEDDTPFSETVTKSRSMSSIPMEDRLKEIHSYKYSRISNVYPAVGNWILTFWSSWLVSRMPGQSLNIDVSPAIDSLMTYCCSGIPIEIRWAAFTHPLTKGLDQILIDYSLNVMSRDQLGFLDIGAALRSLQTQTMTNSSKLQWLLDIILEKCARYWANGLIINTNSRRHLPPDNATVDSDSLRLQEERLLDCIYAMKDDQLRLSESMRYLDLLNIRNAVTLMEFIYSTSPNSATEDLKNLIVTLRIFKRIHDLVIACQKNDQIFAKAHIPTEFLDWHRLRIISEHDPHVVLKFLIKQNEFDLSKSWSRFYMPEDGEQKIEAEYLVSLVAEDNDKEKVVELVSHIAKLHREKSNKDFVRIVQHVLEHSEAPFAIIMICAYIIKYNLFDDIESADGISVCEWRDLVHRSWVGASMLRSISNEVTREQYSQLVQHPHLIMEQLIMNAEIDVFRKMMDLYKEQKKVYHNIMRPQSANKLNRVSSVDDFIVELESERINRLLTIYICKALELSAVREDEDVDSDDFSPTSKYMSSRSSFASMRPDLTFSSESGDTVVNADVGQLSMMETMSVAESYSLSALPPTPHQWTKDSDAPKCMCCTKEVFSMFNRRHHCRRCGHVICSQCSTHRTLIEGVTVRICDNCFRSINYRQEFVHRTRISSVAEQLYSRHNLPPRSDSISSLPSVPAMEGTENILQLGVGALENGWRLGTDIVENETIRQMFNYDDAPSVTIAFCLADFHSNSNICGNVLLDRVEYLADFLKPMKNHLPNSEVDYLLVLDIAKQIAYKAKLKFSRLNNDLDFDRAETYLSRLDLLNVLVKSNFACYLPSLSDGSKFIDRIQSLRDKLIREERLDLAGIVSSKAGLSSDPVFVAMGLHALEEAKYDEARRLFSSCSKFSRYGPQSTTTLPYPVNDIMKILEGNRLSIEWAKEMLLNVTDSDDLLKTPDLPFKDREMNRKQIEEAIYYLDTYNAPLHCLKFLCRQRMWSKAVDYVFKKNVTREVFIDGLILPAITIGHFASVKSEILMKEGGLSSGKFYYESLCKCLDRKGCYDDLLEFQEKMGDHFQAARTLTNHFYLRGAQSYTDLKDRIGFLEKACSHLEILIHRKDKDANIELPKLTKNLILIKQQMEATLFLSDPLTLSRHKAKLGYIVPPNNPPTLFGGSEAILDLCLTILFCRPSLADGLQILCPLMMQCHIYPEVVLPKAAVWLLQHAQLVLPTANVESDTAGVSAVLDLCTNISSCYRLDSRKNDDVLVAILPVIPLSLLMKSNLVSRFISLIKSESKKIDAYIVVKDFKRAFSSSVHLGYVNEVQRILELAVAANDNSGVIDLCNRWLAQKKISVSVDPIKTVNP